MSQTTGVLLLLALTFTTTVTGQTNKTDRAAVCTSTQTLYATVGRVDYIKSPRNPHKYTNNVNVDCGWLIDAGGWDSNNVVKVTILKARMRSCCDYVQLYDSSYGDASRSLGKFYSMPDQTIYYSSGQYMYIKYITDESGTSSSFKLKYEAVAPQNVSTSSSPLLTTTTDVETATFLNTTSDVTSVCSLWANTFYAAIGQLGYLTSPGYPLYYHDNADCRWLVDTGDSDYVVKLTILDANTEPCSECCDYIQLFDGESNYSPSLMRLCNMGGQTVFYSSGHYMYIRFYSDDSWTYRGFRLSYEAVYRENVYRSTTFLPSTSDVISVCSLYANTFYAAIGQPGYLTSPGYPLDYHDNSDCRWLVDTDDSDYVVKVTILDANMESCCDYIQLFDGESDSSPSLIRLYNMGGQTVFYSSGHYMYIRFYSDGSETNTGFRLSYEAVYRENVYRSSVFFSPYTTILPSTSDVTSVCSLYANTFYAAIGQLGYLTSPGYPQYYHDNSDCRWLVDTDDSDYVVKVTILDANMESCWDYIQLFDGGSNSSPSLTRLCNMYGQTVFYSSGHYMYIKFYSDGSGTNTGFRLSYEAVYRENIYPSTTILPSTSDVTSVCSLYANTFYAAIGQLGYLTSPGYPQYYHDNSDCRWLVDTDDSDYVVKVTILDANMESCWDYIQLFDGGSNSSPSLTRLCNMYGQTVFYSSGHYMYIKFYSDGSGTNTGFRLSYEAVYRENIYPSTTILPSTSDVTSVCSLYANTFYAAIGQLGYLTSPGYPQYYHDNADCRWLVDTGESDYVVKVTILDANMEPCSECCDYIQLFDGWSDSSPSLTRLCNMYGQTVFYSSGHYMYIKFYSDDSGTYRGFRLSYEAVYRENVYMSTTILPSTSDVTSVCSLYANTFYAAIGQLGYLTSPGYPQYYNDNADCRWLVDTGDSDYVVKVTILDANMESCNPCCDYLEVFDGVSDSSPSLTTLCNMAGQTVFYSSGHYMYIKFYSDSTATFTGFRLSYEAVYEHSVPTSAQSAAIGHVTTAIVGGVLGIAFLAVLIILIYVVRCRRQRLRPRNTYLYNDTTTSSNNNLLYTTTAPPAYNSVYVVGAPPPYPGIATLYPFAGITNSTFVPTETAEEEGAVVNPSPVAQDEEPKLEAPTESHSPPLQASGEEFTNSDTASLLS